MRQQYRSLIEALISHQEKLGLAQGAKRQAEAELIKANAAVSYNEGAIKEIEDQLSSLESTAMESEAKV